MMAMKSLRERGLREIELLLPWYAAGALSPRDTRGVEKALERDARLAEQYAAVEEEYAAIMDLNEGLGMPSERAMQKLFASIDGERTRNPSVSIGIAVPSIVLSSREVA